MKKIIKPVSEEKQKGVDGKACWKGYKRMGTKQKGGKTVDNCVPMKKVKESASSPDVGDDTVGFSVNSEQAYNAVMAKFGDHINHDETSGIMYVPAQMWRDVELVAFDADGEGAVEDNGFDDQYGVAETTGDQPFDNMMKKVTRPPTAKARNAERILQKRQREEETRERKRKGENGFGASPADKLSIRKSKNVEERGLNEVSKDYKDLEDRINGTKPPAKRTPRQTDYEKKRKQQKSADVMTESMETTYEDVLSKLKSRLSDYLGDVAKAVKDTDLGDQTTRNVDRMTDVKTVMTDDGHEIRIRGNEDDGFRITIKNKDSKSKFATIKEAEIAANMYCKRRAGKTRLPQDYESEK
jgi:hypothetical protein